jgi:cobalt-zinc-cadmium resistance protein CzcA
MVQAFVSGRDLVGYVADAKADIAAHVTLPQGYRVEWGGQFENQQRASARLMVVLPISLAMIFVVLYATLASARASLLILVNIPFALVGAWCRWRCRGPISLCQPPWASSRCWASPC